MSLILMTLAFFFSLSFGQMDVKPIAHLSFDEGTGTSAGDISGNGHDATLTNTDESIWIDGKFGKALSFDGVDDRVTLDYTSEFNFSDKSFAMSMWLNMSELPRTGRFITYGTFNLQQTDYQGSFIRIQVKNPSGGKLSITTSDTAFIKNEWVLLTVVRDVSVNTVYFYANDSLVKEHQYGDAYLNWDFGTPEGSIFIGHNTNITDPAKYQVAKGGIDDVRFYDQALDADQVKELYEGSADVLVAHWPMNEGAGNDVADVSGYGNNAKMVNMEESSWIEGKALGALQFDGVDDKIVVRNTEGFGISDTSFSISMWVNCADSAITARFLTFGSLSIMQHSEKTFRIMYKNLLGNKVQLDVPYNKFVTKDWVLLTAVRNLSEGNVKLYANTEEVGSLNETAGELDLNSDTLVIGANFNPDPAKHQGAKGGIDDFRIYRKALSPEEILDLFAAGNVNYYDLNVTAVGNGSVTLSPDGGTYPEGTVVMLTAVADALNHFENWTGDLTGTEVSTTIIMDADKNITANFAEGEVKYKLKVLQQGEGFVARSTADSLITSGTEVTLTAVAAEGYEFEQWIGSFTGYESTLVFNISEDVEVTAVFVSAGPTYNILSEIQAYDATTIDGANVDNNGTGGIIWTNNPGYTGDGFIDFENIAGTSILFTLNAPSAGSYVVIVRYAHGGEGDRPAKVDLNGTELIASFSMPPTGAWSIWKKVIVPLNLNAGENTIKFTSLDAAGMVNFDKIELGTDPSSSIKEYASSKFRLDHNYPNPAGETTQIHYSLKESGMINLSVFDFTGRKVKELVNQTQNQGEYDLRMNLDEIKSGIYFVRLRYNNTTAKTIKMTVLK